jgi:muconolactone delta-isomerase
MEFIVSMNFLAQDLAEMAPHISQERARIQELREQGAVKALYISADRLHVWLVMQGESQEQVQKDLESLPLHPYMKDIAITPLARL